MSSIQAIHSILNQQTSSTIGGFQYPAPSWPITTTPYNLVQGSTNPAYYNNSIDSSYSEINLLENLTYDIDFDIDEDEKKLLETNIKGIRKNKFLFSCKYDGNRIQPYELIMKLIKEKIKFTITINVSDVLSIKYLNAQFIKIENNLNFNTKCDFSVLKVKFKYEKINHQNNKLSTKEIRIDKLKKLKEIQE